MVFHALDVETGKSVAVRRFFPFGADGGGLFDEERAGYDVAVARLAGLTHPGLRAVLAGGCDPVDGMPFVVTEWINGESLAETLERGTFTPEAAMEVLDRALELSEALSQVLGEEAVWVETAPSMILADSEENGRGFTFCISPMKWLGVDATRRSLLAMAELAEALLGWRDRLVADQAGKGLGAWVKWLRGNAETITLFEVRQSLAEFMGATAPGPARSILHSAPTVVLREPASKQPLVLTWVMVVLAVLVVLVTAAGWLLTKRTPQSAVVSEEQPAPAATTTAATAPAAPVIPQNAEAKRLAEINAKAAAMGNGGQAQVVTDAVPGPVLQYSNVLQIISENGQEVSVEGILKKVTPSTRTDHFLYLEFTDDDSRDGARGRCLTKNAPADMSEEALGLLIGKNIRITGVVKIETSQKKKKPVIQLKDRSAITDAP